MTPSWFGSVTSVLIYPDAKSAGVRFEAIYFLTLALGKPVLELLRSLYLFILLFNYAYCFLDVIFMQGLCIYL